MSLPVHWVESLAGAAIGTRVDVRGDEAHHAVAVRRLRLGEVVVLTDGLGRSATGPVVHAAKGLLTVEVARVEELPEPLPRLTVVQAVPKGDRGELAVEVLTEVGVARIQPWIAERSVAVWKGERGEKALRRWRSRAREAAKQSRRVWFPEVSPLVGTAEVLALVAGADLAVVLHESAPSPLSAVEVPDAGELLVVVGPEGGLTETEVAAFTQAGGRPVRLGAEVLRTSTAGVVAAAALLARTARWA